MADLLIKGMEMPKTCFDCPFLRDDFCVVLGYEMRNDQILMGCGSCPLLEVRPHGKLKDFNDILAVFDKVIHDVDDKTNALLCDLLVQIQFAPTVLEANYVF